MRKTAHRLACIVFGVSFVLALVMMLTSLSSCVGMYEANIYHASYQGGGLPGWYLFLANWVPTTLLVSGVLVLWLGERRNSSN